MAKAWIDGAWQTGAWVDGAWVPDAPTGGNLPGWVDGAWVDGAWIDGSWGSDVSATVTDTYESITLSTIPMTLSLSLTNRTVVLR